MPPRPLPDRVAAVAALDDPVRRAVFELVTRSPAPVGRDAAAAALGVSRRIAAFHLDRLAEQGLLAVEFRRPPGRSGPGAGRPAKLYRRGDDEVAVSVPERHYDLVGELLAAAVTESIGSGVPVQEILHRTAYDAGKNIGSRAADLPAALEDLGYEPQQPGPDGVVLRNCPFHRLAEKFTALVCAVNLQLVRGVADGTGDGSYRPELDPGLGHCCVRLRPAAR